jgi:hypothetical protein
MQSNARIVIPILVPLLYCLAGCGGNNSTQPQSPPDVQPQSLPSNAPRQPPSVKPPQQSRNGNSSNNPAPVIPEGAQYTIFCARVEGDMHVERANHMRDELKKATSMKDWYVVHDAGQSLLYYGYYRCLNDPKDAKESQRAQKDRAVIDQMTDPMGNRPFAQALFLTIDAPDPSAPPEWNLANASGDCSLLIAVYKGSPQRKEYAVAAVRDARARKVDAYYYHGPTESYVCIGHWPKSAYRMTGDKAEAKTSNPDEQIVVAPMSKDKVFNQELTDIQQNNNMRVVQKDVQILDPTLRDAMAQYPTCSVNGMDYKQIVNGKESWADSKLIPIPHEGSAEASPSHAPGESFTDQRQPMSNQQPAYDPSYRPNIPRQTPQQPVTPGAGRLKSIGD